MYRCWTTSEVVTRGIRHPSVVNPQPHLRRVGFSSVPGHARSTNGQF